MVKFDTEEECTGIICKLYQECPHPSLCQDKCFDEDLSYNRDYIDGEENAEPKQNNN